MPYLCLDLPSLSSSSLIPDSIANTHISAAANIRLIRRYTDSLEREQAPSCDTQGASHDSHMFMLRAEVKP